MKSGKFYFWFWWGKETWWQWEFIEFQLCHASDLATGNVERQSTRWLERPSCSGIATPLENGDDPEAGFQPEFSTRQLNLSLMKSKYTYRKFINHLDAEILWKVQKVKTSWENSCLKIPNPWWSLHLKSQSSWALRGVSFSSWEMQKQFRSSF